MNLGSLTLAIAFNYMLNCFLKDKAERKESEQEEEREREGEWEGEKACAL